MTAATARWFRRGGAAAASGALLAAMVLTTPASSAPLSPGAPDLDAASVYLVDQLVGGQYYDPSGFGADIGVTIDAALALAATGADDGALADITAWVAANQRDYTLLNHPEFGAYASGGEIGKVALLAEATGSDPASFGGVDLISALTALVCTGSAPIGQSACAAPGNYAGADNVFKQSLAILGHLRGGAIAAAAAPVAFLAGAQQPSGAWSSSLQPGAAPDIDSTAMAAMALALDPSGNSRAAVTRALAWIADQQLATGGFPGTAGDSTNTAGLAIQALRLDSTTYYAAIVDAEAALATQQNADGGFDISIENAAGGSDVRASAQATGGAAGIPFGSLLRSVASLASADDAAAYLVAQLVDGNHYPSGFGSGDFGLTADAVLALSAHGGYSSTVAAMTAWLAAYADEYADPDGNGPYPGPYSGGIAKLALVAQATGGDATSFGGFDLLSVLTDGICTAADPLIGCTAAGEFFQIYASVSQALGVLALQGSADAADHLSVDSPAVVRLSQLQCADGGFSSTLIAPGDPCTSDVDTTGFAVQALAAVAGTDLWLGAAQAYLIDVQSANGLFPGAAGDNSNSTALAAVALQSLTESLAYPTAASTDTALTPAIQAWQAAIAGLTTLAIDGSGYGISDTTAADPRSSAQALLAASFGTLVGLSGAPLQSAPRSALVIVPPTEPPTSEPATTDPAGGGPATALPTPTPELAATGAERAGSLSLWGAALVLAGAAALALGRPVARSGRRH